MLACLSKPIDAAQLLRVVDELAVERASAAPARGGSPPGAPVDVKALRELEALGGPEFVDEIVGQFTADAAAVLAAMARAADSGDVEEFRDQAHALRSCAANVGAQRVYHTCLAWREIDGGDLSGNGAAYLAGLEAELAQATAALTAHLSTRTPGDGKRRSKPQLRIVS